MIMIMTMKLMWKNKDKKFNQIKGEDDIDVSENKNEMAKTK